MDEERCVGLDAQEAAVAWPAVTVPINLTGEWVSEEQTAHEYIVLQIRSEEDAGFTLFCPDR